MFDIMFMHQNQNETTQFEFESRHMDSLSARITVQTFARSHEH